MKCKSCISIFVFITVLSFLGFFQKPISAQSSEQPFRLDLASSYRVQLNGETRVSNEITVTNTTPTQYLSEYALSVTSGAVTAPRVSVDGEPVQPELIQSGEQSTIRFDLPEVVAGVDQKQVITVSYRTTETALLTGNTLSVYVPRVSDYDRYHSFSVTLETPAEYGGPARTTPQYNTWQEANISSDDVIVTSFEPKLGESIVALFGDEQFYDMELRYELHNPTGQSGLAQIALPPDTPYQRMQYRSLDPQPEQIERDADGNWIATYEIAAENIASISARAVAAVRLEADPTVPSTDPLPQHLASAQYWELAAPPIRQAAADLQTPREIYDFVVGELSYDTRRLEESGAPRLGAARTLAQPSAAVCQEYTDLFVTLARANDIPARRITGYAYTENSQLRPLSLVKDVLHAWPDFWNESEQRWQQVDPTWEDTTGGVNYFDQFDLKHLTFATNGVSSTTPLPAGSYRLESSPAKLLSINFADRSSLDTTPPEISIQPSRWLGIPLPGYYTVELSNQTGRAWYQLEIEVDGTIFQPEPLLPWQSQSIPIHVTEPGNHSTKLQLLQQGDIIQSQDVILTGLPPALRSADGFLREQRARFDRLDPTTRAAVLGVGIGLVLAPLGAGSVLVLKRRR